MKSPRTFSLQNLNLTQLSNSGSLHFIDVVPMLGSPENPDSFRTLFEQVNTVLDATETSTEPTLVILDDITTLEWIGYSALAATRFCRALRALCLKVRSWIAFPHVQGWPSNRKVLLFSFDTIWSCQKNPAPCSGFSIRCALTISM